MLNNMHKVTQLLSGKVRIQTQASPIQSLCKCIAFQKTWIVGGTRSWGGGKWFQVVVKAQADL